MSDFDLATMGDEEREKFKTYFKENARNLTINDFFGENILKSILVDIESQLKDVSMVQLLSEEGVERLCEWLFDENGERLIASEIELPLFMFSYRKQMSKGVNNNKKEKDDGQID